MDQPVCFKIRYTHIATCIETLYLLLQADILHPFASLEWSECKELPVEMTDAQAVWLEDKLYMGGGNTSVGLWRHRNESRVYIYAPTTDTWDTMDTPVHWFALTTYYSQLVLVGGREYVGELVLGPFSNKLWTLDEQNELQETLPPMRVRRSSATAVSHGDHLLVAGGISDSAILDVVEVYSDHNWSSAQSLPNACNRMKSTVLDGHWYLMGGNYQGKVVYYASLDSLIASSQPSETSQPSSVWKRLPDVHNIESTPSVFVNRLTAIGGRPKDGELPISLIHAFSPHTQSWVHVGDLPVVGCKVCTVVLPSGELLVVGGFLNNTNKVYKATLNG